MDQLKIYQTPCACFTKEDMEIDGWHCVCTDEERILRYRMVEGCDLPPLEPQERAWCVQEADWHGEGYYQRVDLEQMSDEDLCRSVIDAWVMYCQSQGLL